jgi:hypothetical protein
LAFAGHNPSGCKTGACLLAKLWGESAAETNSRDKRNVVFLSVFRQSFANTPIPFPPARSYVKAQPTLSLRGGDVCYLTLTGVTRILGLAPLASPLRTPEGAATMDFIDKIREIAVRIPKQLEHIQTEEATKSALVMPFIAALGYNVFDPTEVTPELNADVGIKKGEKVDYAILRDGKPIILFECKHHAADLSKTHASQLYRYFSVTEARFGVLTNGVLYWFFTDLEAPNKMDAKPFFEFNMLDFKDASVEELKKFSKSNFDLNNIMTTASELKYTREIRRILLEQMQQPSDELVKIILAKVYTGRVTQVVREQFAQLIRQAFSQVVNDQINERLKTAMASVSSPTTAQAVDGNISGPQGNGKNDEASSAQDGVITTVEEMEAYYTVKAILRDVVATKRVILRDVQSYCGVLLDDNNRRPICRFHFNRAQKYVGFFTGEKEERVSLNEVDDLYKHAERLRVTVQHYLEQDSSKKLKAPK